MCYIHVQWTMYLLLYLLNLPVAVVSHFRVCLLDIQQVPCSCFVSKTTLGAIPYCNYVNLAKRLLLHGLQISFVISLSALKCSL